MRVNEVKGNITFKSGHATFGGSGHLSNKPELDVYDLVYIGYRPSGILKSSSKLNYLA